MARIYSDFSVQVKAGAVPVRPDMLDFFFWDGSTSDVAPNSNQNDNGVTLAFDIPSENGQPANGFAYTNSGRYEERGIMADSFNGHKAVRFIKEGFATGQFGVPNPNGFVGGVSFFSFADPVYIALAVQLVDVSGNEPLNFQQGSSGGSENNDFYTIKFNATATGGISVATGPPQGTRVYDTGKKLFIEILSPGDGTNTIYVDGVQEWTGSRPQQFDNPPNAKVGRYKAFTSSGTSDMGFARVARVIPDQAFRNQLRDYVEYTFGTGVAE